MKNNPKANFFFNGIYEPQNLFEIGMHNAEWLTGAACLNDIANEKNIYRELAMLMYAPIK